MVADVVGVEVGGLGLGVVAEVSGVGVLASSGAGAAVLSFEGGGGVNVVVGAEDGEEDGGGGAVARAGTRLSISGPEIPSSSSMALRSLALTARWKLSSSTTRSSLSASMILSCLIRSRFCSAVSSLGGCCRPCWRPCLCRVASAVAW